MTISGADIQDDAAEFMLYLQDRHDPERKMENGDRRLNRR